MIAETKRERERGSEGARERESWLRWFKHWGLRCWRLLRVEVTQPNMVWGECTLRKSVHSHVSGKLGRGNCVSRSLFICVHYSICTLFYLHVAQNDYRSSV